MQSFLFEHSLIAIIALAVVFLIGVVVAFTAYPFSLLSTAGLVVAAVSACGALGVVIFHDVVAQDMRIQYAADRIVAKYDITIDQWGPLDADGGVWVINGEATTCGTAWADNAQTDILLVCGGVEQKIR